ncbi:unnamed protein product [Oikopleura dioica]|uniref:GIY-YIG domain-containing protein n=1 Tax=Oikopleura dioica TaxID=34765 RepID=E4WT38_OIKDI|nr:unnamed protein product [Oikopleura dioica]
MSSYQSSFYVLESENDIESLNEGISAITIKEEKQDENTNGVEDLLNRLQIVERKASSLREENCSLKLQNEQLESLNSSLIEENHNIKYNPLFSSQSSIDSIESQIEKLDEFWDFDEKLGLGVECRRKRKDAYASRCVYCTSIVPQITKFQPKPSGDPHVIRQSLFCDSKNIIYVATCIKCKLMSVGSSVNFKNRLQGYKRNIQERIGDTAFETHMRKVHARAKDPLSLVEIVPIRQYDPRTHNALQLRAHETLWMKRMNTLQKGLNKREEKSTCTCVDYEREEGLIPKKKNEPEEMKSTRRSSPRKKNSVNYK